MHDVFRWVAIHTAREDQLKKILVVGALLAVTAFGCGGDDGMSRDEIVDSIADQSDVDKETAECIVSEIEDDVDIEALAKKEDPADISEEEMTALTDAVLSCVNVEDVLDEG